MTRLLVTGARGFVGRHCLKAAVEAGYEVHATASAGGIPDDLSLLDVTWHICNLLDEGTTRLLLADIGPSHLLHAAWTTERSTYWTSPDNMRWLAATMTLIDEFAKAGGTRFVSVGTCAEYDWAHGFMTEGVTPEAPGTLYGTAKLAAQRMLAAAAGQFGFSAATGRIFFAYGPHENAGRLIPYACRQLTQGSPAQFSQGALLRDFMHVEDVARGLMALVGSTISGPCNVSSGNPVLLSEVALEIGRICGAEDQVQLGALPTRAGDPAMIVGDNRKLRQTGWQPGIALRDGLATTCEWWRAHG